MLPTVINLKIPARMDIPVNGWKDQKASILQKLIETIPHGTFELLTFNREEMMQEYKCVDTDTIILNINVNDATLQSKNETSLKARIMALLNSKMAKVSNYAKKLQPGQKTSQICISVDVGFCS